MNDSLTIDFIKQLKECGCILRYESWTHMPNLLSYKYEVSVYSGPIILDDNGNVTNKNDLKIVSSVKTISEKQIESLGESQASKFMYSAREEAMAKIIQKAREDN